MNRDRVNSIAWAGGIIAIALAATLARRLGAIDTDTVTRIVMGATGLMVAWYGNRMPKTLAPNTCARQIARLGGWSLAISGLIYAGLWAFAPFETKLMFGFGSIVAGISATVAYGLILRARARTAS
ncbi:ammonium transporter [Brevundimonas sp.]|uniref:ammonium transporter n=1 Tax=Brevundimonas sp. TaxID=1871086 RepID=UPI003BA97759